METDWIFKDNITHKEFLTLEILVTSVGFEYSAYLNYYGLVYGEGLMMCSKLGEFLTVPSRGAENYAEFCTVVTYGQLIRMLKEEIKSKSNG